MTLIISERNFSCVVCNFTLSVSESLENTWTFVNSVLVLYSLLFKLRRVTNSGALCD